MSLRIPTVQNIRRKASVVFASVALIVLFPLSASASTTSWSTPTDISSTGGSSYEPQVATDPNGNTTVVWYRYNGSNFLVQSASKTLGGAWSAVSTLSAAGADAWEPKITTDAAGNVTAIWYRNDTIQTAYKPAGGSWSAVTDLTVGPTSNTHSASVTADTTVNLAAIWIQDGKTQVAIKPWGGSWGAATELSLPGSNASGPQIMSDSLGNFTAMWSRNQIIQSTTLTVGGSWETISDVSAAGANAILPTLTKDANGNIYAAWVRGSTVQTASKSAGGTWSSPTDISTPLANASEPKIVSDPLGNLSALWASIISGKYVVYSASKTVNGSWTSPSALSDSSQNGTTKGQLKSDTTGKVTAVWSRSNGTHYIIQTSSKLANGSWGPAVDLSVVGGNAAEPQLGIDGRGNVYLTWTRNNGSNTIVQANNSSSSYAVSFSANGGSGSESTTTYSTVGPALTLPSGSSLIRSGYNFTGWNTSADGTGTNYSSGANLTPTSDLSLFAQWESVATPTPAAELADTGTNGLGVLFSSLALAMIGTALILLRRAL